MRGELTTVANMSESSHAVVGLDLMAHVAVDTLLIDVGVFLREEAGDLVPQGY